MSRQINLVHPYPKEMNIYGDTGNRLVLVQRMKWRGIEVVVHLVGVGESIPDDTHIIIGGGGQDAGQSQVQDDLLTKAAKLKELADKGVPMLMVCGLYQLFGKQFVTSSGQLIKGIGILPVETTGGSERHIGNTVYKSAVGEIVGYENHSVVTKLLGGATALAQVIKGVGNNGDGFEGCVVNSVFGTYSHGPVLSKNPTFADELIRRALKTSGQDPELLPLDDTIELAAAAVAKTRPR